MKKLLIISASVLIGFASCYKEKKALQAYDVFTMHKWKIESRVDANVDTGADCRVPSEVAFNKDSTGYFYYTTSCVAGETAMKTFRWTVSFDNRNLIITNYDGKAGANITVGISYFNHSTMALHANVFNGHYVDGNYRAYADKE